MISTPRQAPLAAGEDRDYDLNSQLWLCKYARGAKAKEDAHMAYLALKHQKGKRN